VLADWSEQPHRFQTGTRWPLDGPSVSALVAAPIVVDGTLWGSIATGQIGRGTLPAQIEERLAEFTDLVATAISNSTNREELARLAAEQPHSDASPRSSRKPSPRQSSSRRSARRPRACSARVRRCSGSSTTRRESSSSASRSSRCRSGHDSSSRTEWLRQRCIAPDALPVSTRWTRRRRPGQWRRPR
jgi:hypothetical protein